MQLTSYNSDKQLNLLKSEYQVFKKSDLESFNSQNCEL